MPILPENIKKLVCPIGLSSDHPWVNHKMEIIFLS